MEVREVALMVGVIYAVDHDEVDLSGEWADRPTGPLVMAYILDQAGVTHNPDDPHGADARGHRSGSCSVCDWWDCTTEVLDAFEEGFSFYQNGGGL